MSINNCIKIEYKAKYILWKGFSSIDDLFELYYPGNATDANNTTKIDFILTKEGNITLKTGPNKDKTEEAKIGDYIIKTSYIDVIPKEDFEDYFVIV